MCRYLKYHNLPAFFHKSPCAAFSFLTNLYFDTKNFTRILLQANFSLDCIYDVQNRMDLIFGLLGIVSFTKKIPYEVLVIFFLVDNIWSKMNKY